MARCVPGDATVARLGGNMFALVVANSTAGAPRDDRRRA
jgi:GGDEF domain-containing protein